jgi:SAM-dependent methyltransferase
VSDHVQRNREAWDSFAERYAGPGRAQWEANQPTWGIYSVPEAGVGMLPPSVDGVDVIELGCGTAYVSSWLARRGARPVGIDNSPAQLETARRLQAEFGMEFPLRLGNAEQTPFPDESFDLAISEYGASIWCDPYLWSPRRHASCGPADSSARAPRPRLKRRAPPLPVGEEAASGSCLCHRAVARRPIARPFRCETRR